MKYAYVLFSALFLSLLLTTGAVAKFDQPTLSPEVAKAYIETSPDLVILDVREPSEFEVGHYEKALNIPVGTLEARFAEVPEGKAVLVHCAKGARAERAFKILKEKRPDLTELYYVLGAPIF